MSVLDQWLGITTYQWGWSCMAAKVLWQFLFRLSFKNSRAARLFLDCSISGYCTIYSCKWRINLHFLWLWLFKHAVPILPFISFTPSLFILLLLLKSFPLLYSFRLPYGYSTATTPPFLVFPVYTSPIPLPPYPSTTPLLCLLRSLLSIKQVCS